MHMRRVTQGQRYISDSPSYSSRNIQIIYIYMNALRHSSFVRIELKNVICEICLLYLKHALKIQNAKMLSMIRLIWESECFCALYYYIPWTVHKQLPNTCQVWNRDITVCWLTHFKLIGHHDVHEQPSWTISDWILISWPLRNKFDFSFKMENATLLIAVAVFCKVILIDLHSDSFVLETFYCVFAHFSTQ